MKIERAINEPIGSCVDFGYCIDECLKLLQLIDWFVDFLQPIGRCDDFFKSICPYVDFLQPIGSIIDFL